MVPPEFLGAEPSDLEAAATLTRACFAQSSLAQLLLGGPDHRVRWANGAAARTLGSNDVVGRDAAPLLEAYFAAPFAKAMDEVRATGLLRVVRARPAAGPLCGHVYDVGLRRWTDAAGQPGGLVVTLVDVSAYEDFRQHAKATEEARGAFTDGLAHDLRGPLTAIRLALEAMAQSTSLATIHRKAERALQALRRADDLIENLLDISGVQAGVLLPNDKAHLDLVPSLRAVLRECRETFSRTVHFAHEARLTGAFDARLMGRALYNLVQNAARYGDPGTPIDVRLHRNRDNRGLQLAVRNLGPTIAAADQARILGRFVRGHNAGGHAGGWGLGLMVVQAVAHAHGGTLRLTSEAGVTEFALDLPLAPEDAAPPATPPPAT